MLRLVLVGWKVAEASELITGMHGICAVLVEGGNGVESALAWRFVIIGWMNGCHGRAVEKMGYARKVYCLSVVGYSYIVKNVCLYEQASPMVPFAIFSGDAFLLSELGLFCLPAPYLLLNRTAPLA